MNNAPRHSTKCCRCFGAAPASSAFTVLATSSGLVKAITPVYI